jgi:predicted Zn-dependent peptidase
MQALKMPLTETRMIARIRALTREQIQALAATEIRNMTPAQFRVLNEQIQAIGVTLTPEQNEALNKAWKKH